MARNNLAILGGSPELREFLPVGQLYFPAWDRYISAMEGIFQRRYYTNQGPLVNQFEERLKEYLGVSHVICVTNATIGLMMAAEALQLSGKVILPAFTFAASAQSLSWAGIHPVFCDVDQHTHQIDITLLDNLLDDQVSAIMGVNLWGGTCDPTALMAYATVRNLEIYFDSAHAFGCEINNKKIGSYGKIEIFSFHATKILSSTEGGCLCTNDDEIAARLKNIRSSYGAGTSVEVVKTANGRMSEAQAAIGLMSLEDFPKNRQNNEELFKQYEVRLKDMLGITLLKPVNVSISNYQYLVCDVDESLFGLSRDTLLDVLRAENILARRYFYPGLHRTIGFEESFRLQGRELPVTDHLCNSCIQLPIGALVTCDAVDTICDIIQNSHIAAPRIRQLLGR